MNLSDMLRIIGTLLLCTIGVISLAQITVVVDQEHTKTSTVEAYTASVSTGIKALLENGFIEKISKVQEFFKVASDIVSAVVRNLKMTKELIEVEKDIIKLYKRSLDRLEEAEDFTDKWKYRWILGQLFLEAQQVFELFDLATQQNKGIIDDKGRIQLIKHSLKEAKRIKRSMYATVRRTNRHIYAIKRQQKELEVFTNLFE